MERRLSIATRAATLAAAAAGWSVAAYFLWASSRVPDDFRLPKLHERSYFGGHVLARAIRFERFERWDFVLAELALLCALAFYAQRGHRFASESAAGRIGTGMLLGMLGFGIVWLVQIPFRAADFWWQTRYHVVKGNVVAYVVGDWLQLGAEFVSLCLALLIVMGLAGIMGRYWWVLGGPAFVGIAALFLFVSPYLTNLKRVHDPRLAADGKAIAAKEGVGDIPLRVEKVSDQTTFVNAYAFGMGPSRRVVLWDPLLRYPRREVDVVIAHEYGHQARNHLLKGIAWYALFAIPGALLIEVATRRRGGMRDPLAVPLALLVLAVLQLAASPIQALISRRIETEADWMALQTTRDPRSAQSLFTRFTTTDLSDPSPPTWSYVLLADHPTGLQRIAFAREWAARYGGRARP